MSTRFLSRTIGAAVAAAAILGVGHPVLAQAPAGAPPATAKPTPPVVVRQVELPAGYVIGAEDVLAIVFWREKDLSIEGATVRPDGKITLPLINDVQAAGLTPDQLREQIQSAASKFVADPSVTVAVQTIKSRKVFITGQIAKPGPYALTAPTTIMQLIAMAGGLNEFADTDRILIMRTEGGKQISRRFNYKDVQRGRNLNQNIELMPGDTIVVP